MMGPTIVRLCYILSGILEALRGDWFLLCSMIIVFGFGSCPAMPVSETWSITLGRRTPSKSLWVWCLVGTLPNSTLGAAFGRRTTSIRVSCLVGTLPDSC